MASKGKPVAIDESEVVDVLRDNPADTPPDDTDRPGESEVIDAQIVSDPDAPGTQVARRRTPDIEPQGIVTSTHPAMVMLNQWLSERASAGNEADAAIADIVSQVLSAGSVEEVLADIEAMGLQQLVGEIITIHDGKWQRSTYEEGSPWYAVLDATRHSTGERRIMTTGAQTVIAQIVRLVQLDALPVRVKIVYSTKEPTAKGHRPYKLSLV